MATNVVIDFPRRKLKRARKPLTVESAVKFAAVADREGRQEDAIRLIDLAYSLADGKSSPE